MPNFFIFCNKFWDQLFQEISNQKLKNQLFFSRWLSFTFLKLCLRRKILIAECWANNQTKELKRLNELFLEGILSDQSQSFIDHSPTKVIQQFSQIDYYRTIAKHLLCFVSLKWISFYSIWQNSFICIQNLFN